MVAVQVLLMNYFLLGLHTDQQISNDVLLPDEPLLTGGDCSYGCLQCSPINGCLACKPPYFLYLHRDGSRQTALCTRSCPIGFYKLKRKNKQGFCAKCMLRGCRECSTRHYCSVCKRGLVRYAGRCRKRCPEGTLLSHRFPGLCLSEHETVPEKSSNEIEVNGTIPSWKPPLSFPGTRKPHHRHDRPPSLSPSVPLYPSHKEKGVLRRIHSHPTTTRPPDAPSVTRLEETYVLYPEMSTTGACNDTSPTTPRPRRRSKKKKKRKKKRRKEKDKRRHERNKRRKARERKRRRRLRNKERRRKKENDSVSSTVQPVIPIDH